jgi:hypothetical protein
MFCRNWQSTGVSVETGALQFALHKGIVQQEVAVGQQSTNKTLGNESNQTFSMFPLPQKKLFFSTKPYSPI